FTVHIGQQAEKSTHGVLEESGWVVTIAETGADTMTGGRILRVRDYVGKETFMCTYGDGLADVDIAKLLAFHKSHGKIATMTAVHPISRFGVLDLADDSSVKSFVEKPQIEGWINAGYFIFEPQIFDYLEKNSILEKEPLSKLASEGQLVAFKHEGFFQPMDTVREMMLLNVIWDSNDAPWKVWK
ncbi:MAG: sugar phosphate nucleotidyltransferase, partial [bacterium]